MTKTELIEAMARAIAEAAGVHWGGPRGVTDPDFILVGAMYRLAATAALAAIEQAGMVVVPKDDATPFNAGPFLTIEQFEQWRGGRK